MAMRDADIAEVKASHGLEPLESLELGLKRSRYATVVTFDGVPSVIYGLANCCMLTGIGSPWMLASENVNNHLRALLKLSPPIVREMLEICPKLYNYVDVRNRQSIRWLVWLGFKFEPAEPYGLDNLPFHRFSMEKGA